jgi:hypothetical protein
MSRIKRVRLQSLAQIVEPQTIKESTRMSPNDFATPTYDETTTAALDQPTGELDLNDPKFLSEDIGINPEGDAYATPRLRRRTPSIAPS